MLVLATLEPSIYGLPSDMWLVKDAEGVKGKVNGGYTRYNDNKEIATICFGANLTLQKNKDYINDIGKSYSQVMAKR